MSYALYSSEGAGKPDGIVNTGGADREAVGAAALTLNAWTHIATTYDGATLRTFVNGSQAASRATTGSMPVSSSALRIGGNTIWSEYFNGLIDEVRIYNRALGAGDIQTDMNTPVGAGKLPPPPPDASTIGRWTGPVELGLVAVKMIQLYTGKILMYRGEDAGGSSAVVWNPTTNTTKPVPLNTNIFCSGHAQLADGRILVVGGHDTANGILGSAQASIFDPATETWTSAPPMAQRRWYPSATTLPDGRVLVTSGAKTDFFDYADVPEIYDPKTNSWTQLTGAKLGFPYYPFSFLLADGTVLIAGAGEHPAPTRKLDVANQTWTTVDPAVIEGGSAAMYAPGKFIKSGTAVTTDVSNLPTTTSTYVLDMNAASPQWRQTAPMAYPRAYHTLTPLPDGTVIVTGGGVTTEGKNISAAVYPAEIWSPATESWKTMAPMQKPRLYHGTALLLPDARVVVAGSGDSYGGPNQTTAEFFEPPYLYKGTRPSLTGAPVNVAHGSTFTATTDGQIASVALVRLGADTHQFDEDTRFVPLTFQQNGNELTITAPGNANLAPPGYYMLYAISANGVPSVSSIVRLPVVGADSAPPSAPGTLTATGGLGRIDLVWGAATDNVGVASYSIHRSQSPGFTPTAANRIGQSTIGPSYADTGLPAGVYYYKVTAVDSAGNSGPASNEATATATADTTPPAVSITTPIAGAALSGSVTIAASASDNVGVANVQFLVDGATIGTPDTTAPYQATWTTSSVPNGTHTLTAVAQDATGNTTTSGAVAVTVANATNPPPTGLVGAWSLNAGTGSTATDSSGNNNTGTLNGSAWTTSGKFGQAVSFDGVNDRIDIPDSASLDLTNKMTVEAWVRPTTTSGWRTAVLKEGSGGLAYALYASNGSRPNSTLNIGSTDRTLNGAAGLAANTWSHLAMTYDGATMRLFVNGTQVSSRAQTGNVAVTGNPLRIGGNSIWSEWFNGQIDEVRIYNTVLSAAQVQTDMNTPIG